MADSTFKSNIDALMKGMEGYLNTKTVVGEAINVGDNILVPLADVSFGVGAGAFEGNQKNRGGGGMGAKITPTAILVINATGAHIVSVKEKPDIFQRLLEMAPGLINKLTGKEEKGTEEEKGTVTEEKKEDI